MNGNQGRQLKMTGACSNASELTYGLEDKPSWLMTLWLALQYCLIAATSIAFYPIILSPSMCIFDDDVGTEAKIKWMSSLFFVTGLVTILQCYVGTRLPIFQGSTYTIVAPILAVLSLPRNQCPTPIKGQYMNDSLTYYNDTDGQIVDSTELWQRRMREIQGSLAVASITEVLLGLTGGTAFLMKFIGPVTLGPAIALIGLDLSSAVTVHVSKSWPIAILTTASLTVFSQYLAIVRIPVPSLNKLRRGKKVETRVFGVFSVIFAAVAGCVICQILTSTNVISAESLGSNSSMSNPIKLAPWMYVPYPGHWGLPTISASGIVAMIVAVLTGAAESIGDYHACAKIVKAPPPPSHAVARGITIEGIGCIICGVLSASGSTSYSDNIAAIGITKVGSRRVMIVTGAMMTCIGVISKISAIVILIPTPVIGGIFCCTFGMVTAIGLSMLQCVDMRLGRNQFIIGFSLFFGITIPNWMRANPNAINSGVDAFDQTARILLQTAIFVGGLSAAVLDNTIPGTYQERGFVGWKAAQKNSNISSVFPNESSYDLPWKRRLRFMKYIPIFRDFYEGSKSGKNSLSATNNCPHN